MALEHDTPRRLAVGITFLSLAGLLAIAPAATGAPGAPSPAYLGDLALRGQEAPPDLGRGIPGRLPYTPTPEHVSSALAIHHPRVLFFGLSDDRGVWFVIDEEMKILQPGVAPEEVLHEHLRTLHPESVSDSGLGIDFETAGGLTVKTYWLVPEPPPGR